LQSVRDPVGVIMWFRFCIRLMWYLTVSRAAVSSFLALQRFFLLM